MIREKWTWSALEMNLISWMRQKVRSFCGRKFEDQAMVFHNVAASAASGSSGGSRNPRSLESWWNWAWEKMPGVAFHVDGINSNQQSRNLMKFMEWRNPPEVLLFWDDFANSCIQYKTIEMYCMLSLILKPCRIGSTDATLDVLSD